MEASGFNLVTKTLAPENFCFFNKFIVVVEIDDFIFSIANWTSDSIILKQFNLIYSKYQLLIHNVVNFAYYLRNKQKTGTITLNP